MTLPAAFTQALTALLGEDEYARFASALLHTEPTVSIRLNPQKPEPILSSKTKVPWASSGYYLPQRPTFTFDPWMHTGAYYVQEASSMFLEQALRQWMPSGPLVMLDLCAAPGGKSTHARSLLPPGSLLVSNEVIPARAQVLVENLTKWGHPDVVITQSEAAAFIPLGSVFDIVLVDAPCSGEGMFRKDEGAVSEWSPENVRYCVKRQRRILTDIWPTLKPGGLLIYSTCTYNIHENEENVRWLQDKWGAEVLPLSVDDAWGITGNLLAGTSFPVYRFLPHRAQGEGFFLAVLRKPSDETETNKPFTNTLYSKLKGKRVQARANAPAVFGKEQLDQVRKWLTTPDAYTLLPEDNRLTAFPTSWLPLLQTLKRTVRILQSGVPLAEMRGKDCLPLHALAMSTLLKPNAFPRAKVDFRQAIDYLRREVITLPGTTSRGIVLLTYDKLTLGFVKNLETRANNLYPPQWRIRSPFPLPPQK